MFLGSGIRDPRSGIRKKPISDPGSRGQKAPNPGSGSATLVYSSVQIRQRTRNPDRGSGTQKWYRKKEKKKFHVIKLSEEIEASSFLHF